MGTRGTLTVALPGEPRLPDAVAADPEGCRRCAGAHNPDRQVDVEIRLGYVAGIASHARSTRARLAGRDLEQRLGTTDIANCS